MPDENIVFIGETDFRNEKRKFGIKPQDRRRHLYIIGKSGTGKTTLQENMAIQDIQAGRGVGIVDPHGEFAEKMLDFIPANRINDVVYFNPADLNYPVAFNVMERVDVDHRHLVADGIMGVFKKIWIDLWSARMEYITRNTILALLEYPGSTLLGINRMLADKEYRSKVVSNVTDSSVKSFWMNEFAKYPDRFREEAVAPIQNKIGQFLSTPLIRNIVGQTKSSVDLRKAMDEQKILIMNVSKGKLGEDNSALLGAMLITKIQLAAMSRIDIPEEERKDFYLYVDEFQNFATSAFATILSEARKFRLNLIIGHQYIAQMRDEIVRDAVFGNVGTIICFRIGAADAEFLEKEFDPEFAIQDLVSNGFAQIYLRLMIDGMTSRPFSATTLPPIARPEVNSKEKIITASRERYASDRHEVEEKLARWIESPIGAKAAMTEENEKKQEQRDLYDATCSQCGKNIKVVFKPDGVRPVYCPGCLKKAKQEKEQSSSNRQFFQKGEEKTISPQEESISLGEAVKKEASDFRSKRKEVDLNELRGALKEAGVKKDEA